MPSFAAPAVLTVVVETLRALIGADAMPVDITSASRLERDLRLESIELAAWAATLRQRYGDAVDLLAYVAGLDLDGMIALTVGDVATYVMRATENSLKVRT